MLKKFLDDAVVLIIGKQFESLAEILHSKKHINEFLIAKKLDITINQTRNLLYKIADQGIVSSIRKKDKKKGWYTYFWRIEILKALEFLKSNLDKEMGQILSQVKSREVKQFYICSTCNVEYSEENALMHDFMCPECGSVFVLKDNTKVLKDLKKTLDRLSKEAKDIGVEIEQERSVIDKQRMKELKLAKEERAKKAATSRKKRADAKKASEKANTKKTKTKKISKKSVKKLFNKVTKKKSVKKSSKKTKKKRQ